MAMQDRQDRPRTYVEATTQEAAEFVANLFKSIVCEAVSEKGCCYLALAGGTTPHFLYQQLALSCASDEVPWPQVEIFFGDERDVPHDDVESNYHMIQKTLLDHVPVAPSQVHPMPADSEDLQAAASEYEKTIQQHVPPAGDGPPVFDLILLGMGADGHIASLFPDTEVLHENQKLVSACFVPVLGRGRMTFTFPLINAARNCVILVTGDDKADAVAALLGQDSPARKKLPASHLGPQGSCYLVLDSAAAKRAGQKSKSPTQG